MQNGSGWAKSVLLAVCLGAATTTWGSDMQAGQKTDTKSNIQVLISGSDEARYAATWTVTAHNGEQHEFEEEGAVPASYAYSGQAIQGAVTVLSASGRVEVEIRKSGNRSRSSTQGKGSVVNISVR